MLLALRNGLRFRLAMALAVFAAICFVAPPAVLAFGHGANTLDCLAHADKVNHGKAQSSHMHHTATAPSADPSSPSDSGSPGKPQMTCCGLFCLSALAAESGVVQRVLSALQPHPTGEPGAPQRRTERLDRPPIVLLFV